ncbi:putative oxidoreductase YcjS [Lacunisphaera limnophila]|uniref:Putative oxidoreductase YcjS n=1 Tax=Lacunisphaera limnophila TaxID=1838286 RepID=A0A1I7PHM2_9BACT|nr:Gfo/Idh/MocA family oxidoreductase [Lacunisphaera limnophila]AOS43109.1 putative oxidoreductase YcjS [Lacunisphaera limnophila]
MYHPAPQNRRDFIKFSALAAALLGFAGCTTLQRNPRKPRPIAAGAKIRLAQIGCGGKGYSDIMAHEDEEVVALCDIDWVGTPNPWDTKPGEEPLSNVKKLIARFPNAKRYTDYRKMLLEMDDQIDAVCVSTPDHMHFLPAYMAILMGKHVYVQKPLTQTVGEARELLRIARLTGVCTQMGNQGHAGEGIRLVKEWHDAGVIGDVREVNVWTNRPVWPQGMPAWPKAEPVPAGLDWDSFLGRAPDRPFSSEIHPFKWRGYVDYGCGALGDMACHLMDAAYWGLDLGAPTSVELKKIVGASPVAFPTSAIVEYQFPARGGKPPVKLTWYEGGLKPEKPAQLEANRELAQGGQLIVGSKATVYDGNDYCNSPRIIPAELHRTMAPNFPPKTIPRVPQGNPHKEWTAAIRAGQPQAAGSNFEYSVPFTETVCLGSLAILVGKKFTWDATAMKTSLPEADQLLYPTYRPGWKPAELA